MFGVLHYTVSAEKLLLMIFACLNIADIELDISPLAIAQYIVSGCPLVEN
jgi:hypothetical protein